MRNELEYIYLVYQKGSFTKAAQALYLTQPALSIAIQKIENEIGMPLFDRNQKPLGLTAAGRIYIDKIEQMRVLETELQSQLLDLTDMNMGTLRIGATSYIISCILPPILLAFKEEYPGISLDIVEAGAYELKELLRDRKLDFTFISQLAKDPDFSYYPGFRDQIILAVPVSFPINKKLRKAAMTCADVQANRHWDSGQPYINLKDFEDTPFILLESKYDLRRRTDAFFSECAASPNICMEITQIVTAFSLALTGIGATFVPDRAVKENHPELVFYKLPSQQTVRNMHIVINNKRYMSKATNRFIDMFVSSYKIGHKPMY